MEPMVFSYAYYSIKDFEKVLLFFKELEKGGLFSIDSINHKSQEMTGSFVFVMDHPKGHWNPLSNLPGAKQVLGGAEVKNDILKIDTKTRNGLVRLRRIMEERLSVSIEFGNEEFQDVGGMLRKR